MNKLDIWKEYESIAMHFNDLLIQLRMKALGGIAIIIALITYAGKSDITLMQQLEIYGFSSAVLAIVWLAIFFIDYFYYNKLLLGAITSTVDLEATLEADINIKFSTEVKSYVENTKVSHKNLWPILFFYSSVFILLVLASVYCLAKAYDCIT